MRPAALLLPATLLSLALAAPARAAYPSSMPDSLFKICVAEEINNLTYALGDAESAIAWLEEDNAGLGSAVIELQSANADLQARLDEASAALADYATQSYVDSAVAGVSGGIEGLSDYLSVDADADAVIFSGANVFIQSGSGSTSGSVNGLGNLIVGYDEDGGDDAKTGSHNLVLGQYNSYSGYAGIVGGNDNAISGASASVLGGSDNAASGEASVVLGGSNNTATHASSVVLGGSSTATSADGDVTP